MLDFIDDSWDEFKEKCGKEAFRTRPQETEVVCYSKYRFTDVKWKGYVIRVDYDDHFFSHYRSTILIKMDKDHIEDPEPDLSIRIQEYQYNLMKNAIFNLTRGDYVEYNATFMSEGNKDNGPTLDGFGIRSLNEHVYIQAHIHHSGKLINSNL